MTAVLTPVEIGSLPLDRFEGILPPERYAEVMRAVERARSLLEGRVLWHVNSTARGGGVAEMLVSLLAYVRALGVDTRWEVVAGGEEFFTLTKRLHHYLHSSRGDGGPLGDEERAAYESTLQPNLDELLRIVGPDDVVVIHDPQPAGMIPALKRELGVPVIWRCHVGVDEPSALTRAACEFLVPYIEPADGYVFSRQAFVWEGLDPDKTMVIAPVIDVFSAKNQDLGAEAVRSILRVAGLEAGTGGDAGDPTFTREDGSLARVERTAEVWEGCPLRSDDRVVLQVSRWDRLKDPNGVIRGFAEHVAPEADAHLVYAGPAVEAVSDDPEGKEVLADARRMYEQLPAEIQKRVHLACLPVQDLEENAAIVNALQRRASIVVQKSIAEGFGLTVAEAMWKARPVVASRAGGIQDQIVDGRSGVLLDDPRDLAAYGTAVRALLDDPKRAARMGEEAQQRVRDEFLPVRSLLQYLGLIESLLR